MGGGECHTQGARRTQELQKVQALLRDQKQAFEHTQRALLGETLTTTPTKAHVPIISPEEMAALMRGV